MYLVDVPVLKSVVSLDPVLGDNVLCDENRLKVFYAALAPAFFVPAIHGGRLFRAVLGLSNFFPTCLAGFVALIHKGLDSVSLRVLDDIFGEGSTANREVGMFLQSREVEPCRRSGRKLKLLDARLWEHTII